MARVTDSDLAILAEASENPPMIQPEPTEENHDAGAIECWPTWKLIGALVADLGEAREQKRGLIKRVAVGKLLADGYVGKLETADRQLQAQMQRAENAETALAEARQHIAHLEDQLADAETARTLALGIAERAERERDEARQALIDRTGVPTSRGM